MSAFPTGSSDWKRMLLRVGQSPLLVLSVLWIILIYRNERLVFTSSISKCEWNTWESWPATAAPHRLVLIADPQLVDPHTYPGRPWPLSSLTTKYTDLYLRRVHRGVQQRLYPDSTVFLGDLFDGGREWATGQSSSPEKRYQKYGESFWHEEYKRFTSIFYDTWQKAGVQSKTRTLARRSIMANVPGNHDLGFANGIQEPVRKRFNAYFGDGNAVWIIGNHTIVTLDTVSLSAKEDSSASKSIWEPTQHFLDEYDAILQRRLALHSSMITHKHFDLFPHIITEGDELRSGTNQAQQRKPEAALPTILLSHVPLYRDEGTPCGPQRERWPPSRDADGKLLEKDERNAISIARGYQYQNVLSPTVSNEIATKLQHVSMAFSGDDHDYCDVTHRNYPSAGSGIREITVKSISWAMGIRRPGIQLVSLWNPESTQSSVAKQTAETQLCSLPDQLTLFVHYLLMLGFTLLVLVLRASRLMRISSASFADAGESLLPTMRSTKLHHPSHGQSSSSDDGAEALMTKRSRLAIPSSQQNDRRSPSPKPSYGYGLPSPGLSNRGDLEKNDAQTTRYKSHKTLHASHRSRPPQPTAHAKNPFTTFGRELAMGIMKLVAIVAPWYMLLLHHD